MTRSAADRLALHVRRASGHEVSVEADGESFMVVVTVIKPRSEALREEFTLWDEDDWDWLKERILGA